MRIGVDLGGTNVRVGIVEGDRIVRLLSEPCKADQAEGVVIAHITKMIAELITPEVEGIGIGVPSVVDAQQGIVYNVVSIPSWHEVHLKEIMEQHFGVPVAVNNDCNCFAIGTSRFGEGLGHRDVVCLALGTGVGAGVIIDRKLYVGHNTGAGEIGSIPYLDKDYEYYCSSRFFVGHGTSGKEACQRAAAGDPAALALWQEFGKHVGNLVIAVLYTYDPEAIVFGGSVAHAFPYFRNAMEQQLHTFPYYKSVEALHIYCSKIDHVALLGASACV